MNIVNFVLLGEMTAEKRDGEADRSKPQGNSLIKVKNITHERISSNY